MSLQLKIVLVAIVLIYIFFILRSVKRKDMRINYLVFWIIIGLMMIFALIIPNLVDNISKLIGFEMPINMIFSTAIFIILYLIFDLTQIISIQERKNVMLIQEISILKKRVDELENKMYEKN